MSKTGTKAQKKNLSKDKQESKNIKMKKEKEMVLLSELKINAIPKKHLLHNEARKRIDAALGLLKLKSSENKNNF